MNAANTPTEQILHGSPLGSKRRKRSKLANRRKASATTKTQVKAPAKKIDKKIPDKPYNDVLEFLKTGDVSLFKNKKYQVSVSLSKNLLQMSPIICVCDTEARPNLIRAHVLHPSWRDSICQCDMPDICSASDTKLKVSGTITLHRRMGESRICVNFGVVN